MVDTLSFSLHENDIIDVGGVQLAGVFTFEVPRLVCSSLDSYLYGLVAVLAVDGIYGSGQACLLLTVNGFKQIGMDN